jgi:hypothetical protein
MKELKKCFRRKKKSYSRVMLKFPLCIDIAPYFFILDSMALMPLFTGVSREGKVK